MKCFKAYDIRGKVPDDLDENMVEAVIRAFLDEFSPDRVVVGRDARSQSPGFILRIISVLIEHGVEVWDAGLCGTEEVYFQTDRHSCDLGIMVTASHNPSEYNGMKYVGRSARPIADPDVRGRLVAFAGSWYANRGKAGLSAPTLPDPASLTKSPCREDYLNHVLTFVDIGSLAPLKIFADSGYGCAGPVAAALSERLPFSMEIRHATPDSSLPLGAPNPMLASHQDRISAAIREAEYDFGVAWDGDFDRCFFFDDTGEFVDGSYVVGLLAQSILERHPGEIVIHDTRLVWNTIQTVTSAGGRPVMCKTGHVYMKQAMRDANAVFGGEISGHYYFRDFSFCDSGMIPWLLMAELISRKKCSLRQLVAEAKRSFPCSGEINFTVENCDRSLARVQDHFQAQAIAIDTLDGWSAEFPTWRMSLRQSNTEPLVRLNVETRGDQGSRIEDVVRTVGQLFNDPG